MGETVGEGLTSAAPGESARASYRMFTTISGPEACAAARSPAVIRPESVEMSVGDSISLSDVVIESFSIDGEFVASVPVDFFDHFPSNVAFERIEHPTRIIYRAKRFGSKSLEVRHYCDSSIRGSLIINVRNDGDVFIDRGACPGEGCRYDMIYRARSRIPVFEQSSTDSAVVGYVDADDIFLAQDGEVHATPTRFVVDRAHGDFNIGDEVLALTYTGEGWWRVRHNGVIREADLGFSPSSGNTCDNPEQCWGHLEKPVESIWWLRGLSEHEVAGWIIASDAIRAIDHRW